MQKTFTKEHTNVVKGFAIILLLMYHLFSNIYDVLVMEVNYAPLNEKTFLTIAGFGNICVSIFVFLTSYGIAKGIYSQKNLTIKDTYQQALKRFFKLMLNFFILYVSVIIVMHPYFDLRAQYGWGGQGLIRMAVDAIGLHSIFGVTPLNASWWYMEVAYLLIFLVPLFALLTQKVGYYIILFAYITPLVFNMNFNIERFLLVAVIGVCAAKGEWIDKVMQWKLNAVFKWLLGIAGLALCVFVRQKEIVLENFICIADAVITLFIVCMISVTIASVPGVKKVFAFIGHHSMNIYLVHTFFYMNIWRKETYQFKYAIVILIVLLAVTLLYSVILEGLKKLGKFLYRKIKDKRIAKKNA